MTESEWRTDINPGYRTKTIRVGNATIEINRPMLAPEEQARAEARVIEAMKGFTKERSNNNGQVGKGHDRRRKPQCRDQGAGAQA